MDILKDIALPQSSEHVQLLLFMMNLVYVVFLPYLGLLLVTSVLSLRFEREGRLEGDSRKERFARDLIGLPLNRKSLPAFMGLIPALSLVFVYAQLFQGTSAIAVSLMGYAFLFLLAAAVLLYWYRFTFTLGDVFASYGRILRTQKNARNDADELEKYGKRNIRTHDRSGRWGTFLLLVAVVLSIGAMTVATNPDYWGSVDTVFALLISPGFYARLAQFLSVGIGLTGLCVLFFFFTWEGGSVKGDERYLQFAKKWGLTLSVAGVLLQPLFLVLNVILLPEEALSGGLFALAGTTVLLFFLTAHFLYGYSRIGRPGFIAYAFYTLGLSLVLLFTADQVAVSNATREQAARLAFRHQLAREDLQARLGIAVAVLSGQEIYESKCYACHLFDEKKVGPPYKSVLGKYKGNKPQLVSFVLNPLKVDPEYPPMPNQGLRPAEADSIAIYLLAEFDAKMPSQAQSSEDTAEVGE
jgi:cytochrome c